MKRSTSLMAIGALSATLAAGSASAQTTVAMEYTNTGRFAALFGAPSAIPASNGFGSVALTWANPRGGIYGRDADADVGLSYSMGNPMTGVNVTFGLSITGTKPFGDSGFASLSIARMIALSPRSATFIGASYSNLAPWGDARGSDPKGSIYLTTTGDLSMGGTDIPYVATLGYGQDIRHVATGGMEDAVFAGVGISVAPGVSASISGVSNSANLGFTFAIPGVDGLAVTAGVYDVTNNMNRRQYSVTIGYGMSNVFGAM